MGSGPPHLDFEEAPPPNVGGASFLTADSKRAEKTLQGALAGFALQVLGTEALPVIPELEGLSLAALSGIGVAGAIRLAQHLGAGHAIATALWAVTRAINRSCPTSIFAAPGIFHSRHGWGAGVQSAPRFV